MEPTTIISTVLTSIKTATDIAKFIKESDASFEKAESKLKLAELISALADAKIEVTDIQQELQKKDAEITVLKEKLNVRGQLKFERPYYWRIDGSQKDGPFCQKCYDSDQKLIRLQANGVGCWECKECKSTYFDSSYKPSCDSKETNIYDLMIE